MSRDQVTPGTRYAPPDQAGPQPGPPVYEPPVFQWEEPFVPVSLALSCNHTGLQGGSCDIAPGG
jgi:hypothetical protein